MEVTRTERGWVGHFISGNKCRFRRNTLIDAGDTKWVVSTVGGWTPDDRLEPQMIGADRYYETMAFAADLDSPYLDADVFCQIPFDSQWGIFGNTWQEVMKRYRYPDNAANEMHEKVVAELMEKIKTWK